MTSAPKSAALSINPLGLRARQKTISRIANDPYNRFLAFTGARQDDRTSTVSVFSDCLGRDHLGCYLFAGIDCDSAGRTSARPVGLAGSTHRRFFPGRFSFLTLHPFQYQTFTSLPGTGAGRHNRPEPVLLLRCTASVCRPTGNYHLYGTAVHLRHHAAVAIRIDRRAPHGRHPARYDRDPLTGIARSWVKQ